MNTCEYCRNWSEMLAQSIGGGPVEAYCFGIGKYNGQYTTGNMSCDKFVTGRESAGAFDDPSLQEETDEE